MVVGKRSRFPHANARVFSLTAEGREPGIPTERSSKTGDRRVGIQLAVLILADRQ